MNDGGRGVSVTLRVLRLAHGEGLPLPTYHSEHAAGLDVVAGVPEEAPVVLAPGARALIPTGFAIELPAGFEAQLRPRSGLALKSGVTLLNSPGTIDADYRGEVKVLLVNLGSEPFTVRRGERIAQLVVARVEHVRVEAVTELGGTTQRAGRLRLDGLASTSPLAPSLPLTGRVAILPRVAKMAGWGVFMHLLQPTPTRRAARADLPARGRYGASGTALCKTSRYWMAALRA